MNEVTVWYMSEEQRLAYIAKHPIVPTEQPKGVAFSNVNTMSVKQNKERQHKETIMDKVNKEDLYKRFMENEKLDDIAKALNISTATLNNFIKDQRKIDPEKWPHRQKQNHKLTKW